jgi:hypothetical protein
MSQKNKSVLLNTSASSDVQYSGGEVLIAGLEPVNQSRIVNISQINYRAEVQQVVTIGATAYTPVADTTYVVEIGDVNRRDHGYTENLKKYIYTTPAVITDLGATAELQREAITLGLVAKINALSSNYVVAASLLLGNGFTVTDDAGYFPYNRQGSTNRKGASVVRPCQNSDGTGFSASNVVLTTAAVYEFGTGATLLNNAAVYDFMTGNLISGEIENPVTITGGLPVSGQKYNMFSITYLKRVALPTAFNGNSYVYLLLNQQAFVDNGAGSATTNLAGYIAFERKMHKLAANVYSKDAQFVQEFFDKNFVIQGLLGAAPATTTSVTNKFLTPYGLLNHVNIGTQTIVAPSIGATGLLTDQDVTTGDGAQYSPSLLANNEQEFVVGKSAFMAVFGFTMTAVTGANTYFGFRKKEAFQLDYNNYNDLVTIGTTDTSGKVSTNGILGNAATVTTTSASVSAVNSVRSVYIVKVDINGVATCYVDGVAFPVYSAGTTALVFPAGTVLVPFFQTTQITGTASVGLIDELLAVNTDKFIS